MVEGTMKLLQIDQGSDYFNRYFFSKNNDVFAYIFEYERERYVWQIDQKITELTEGNSYHVIATIGKRLLGGRGLSIYDVVISS